MSSAEARANSTMMTITTYFDAIKNVNTQYRNVVDKLAPIKSKRGKEDERMALCSRRDKLKKEFIARKQAARDEIRLLRTQNEGLGALKEKELGELQEAFRAVDSEFKALGVMADREALMDGPAARAAGMGGDMPKTNDELLGAALDKEKDNTTMLRDAAVTLNTVKEQAAQTAGQLVESREKISRIDKGLDDVESELQISQKLLVNFVKRLATDKVIIAFTFLVVCGVVGIIIYASLNPSQKIFNVPDAVIPPGVITPTPTLSATPTP